MPPVLIWSAFHGIKLCEEIGSIMKLLHLMHLLQLHKASCQCRQQRKPRAHLIACDPSSFPPFIFCPVPGTLGPIRKRNSAFKSRRWWWAWEMMSVVVTEPLRVHCCQA